MRRSTTNDYAAAIEQLKALGHDDLKADPNHVLTWQYCGLWPLEQGNRDQARNIT